MPWSRATACVSAPRDIWVSQQGGVVVAVNGEHIRVWFPAGMSTGTIHLSL
jgi:hypothetical protein